MTINDKLKELRRELQFRQDVYPLWLEQGKICADTSRHRIEIMREVIADYETLAAQLDLPL